jgi:hypothetical protein
VNVLRGMSSIGRENTVDHGSKEKVWEGLVMNDQEIYEKLSELIERITKRIDWWENTQAFDRQFRYGNSNALIWIRALLEEWSDNIEPKNRDYTTKT